MEHEVFVPVEEERLREVLDDPARVARAVPGLQHDAGADPVAGRLKVRVGSHSVTYRGTVRVSARDDGSYAVEGDAAEARGSGAVKLALRLRLRPTDTGTTVRVTGTATATGRVTELPPEAVTAAATRLLTRFAENLGTSASERTARPADERPVKTDGSYEAGTSPAPDGTSTSPASGAPQSPEAPESPGADASAEAGGSPEADVSPERGGSSVSGGPSESAESPEPGGAPEPAEAGGAPEPADASDAAEAPESPELLSTGDFEARATSDFETTPDAEDAPPPSDAEADGSSVFDAEIPPPSLADFEDDEDGMDDGMDDEDSVAEAAHARRTMIGRSAEEVDHAPPRGRYAPVPAPQTVSSSPSLRWAAPAAALAVASAVVAFRALRRRR